LAFLAGPIGQNGRQTIQFDGLFFELVHIAANVDVVNAAKGDINGSALD
jgi:hypothetical protein